VRWRRTSTSRTPCGFQRARAETRKALRAEGVAGKIDKAVAELLAAVPPTLRETDDGLAIEPPLSSERRRTKMQEKSLPRPGTVPSVHS